MSNTAVRFPTLAFNDRPRTSASRTKGRVRLAERVLTARQIEVFQRVARGLANKQIAAELGISERSVKGHVSDLLRKFDVPNRAGLIATVMSAHGIGLPLDVTRPVIDPALASVLSPTDLASYRDAPIMVAVTLGPKHRYAFMNGMSARVAGREPANVVGKTLREAYPDIDATYEAALDRVYTTGVPWAMSNAPAIFPQEDGTSRDALLHLMFAPLRDSRGTVVGILHIGSELEPDERAPGAG
jgi:DNA-binding CsgD family transcriptional regulator